MTPRQVAGRSSTSEFARQLAERNAKPARKFKSSAPKGVKLAAGYTDRTKERKDEEEDEIAQRVKALEEMMKLKQIDRPTFERLVQEIAGGDMKATHLVKGLDRKLLEKVKQGEVTLSGTTENGEGEDVEEEFDELAEQEIAPVVKEKAEKRGERAPTPPPPPVAGVKRSRDAILAELKAQRQAAAEALAKEHEKRYPSLGPGFRKVGAGGETTRIEIDSDGRQILIITDANGKEKRKIRKKKIEQPVLEPRSDIEDWRNPLKIPTPPPQKEESDDEDIFAGVGDNYNPLADLEGDEDDASEEEGEEGGTKAPETVQTASGDDDEIPEPSLPDLLQDSEQLAKVSEAILPQTSTSEPPAPRPRKNYFNDTPSSATDKARDSADATVLAALKKVRTLDVNSTLLKDTEEARLARRAAELAARDRDMEDIDMGFGESRFDDAEEMEMEGEKVKFSEWKGLGAYEDDDEEGQGGRGAKKRKRGGKKRKGDKNNAADVLKVMERQKGAKPLG
jgi:hypothetical protein